MEEALCRRSIIHLILNRTRVGPVSDRGCLQTGSVYRSDSTMELRLFSLDRSRMGIGRIRREPKGENREISTNFAVEKFDFEKKKSDRDETTDKV